MRSASAQLVVALSCRSSGRVRMYAVESRIFVMIYMPSLSEQGRMIARSPYVVSTFAGDTGAEIARKQRLC